MKSLGYSDWLLLAKAAKCAEKRFITLSYDFGDTDDALVEMAISKSAEDIYFQEAVSKGTDEALKGYVLQRLPKLEEELK